MLSKDLMFIDCEAKSSGEVLSYLADQLIKLGKVTPQFKEKILEREATYPTGIYTGDVNVAIPHADYELVNESSIAVAVLKEPVSFARMEEPEETIEVKLVIMLAMHQPHGHMEILARISELFLNQPLLHAIVASETRDVLYGLIKEELQL